MKSLVTVVIPAFNERWTIRELVRRVYEQSGLLHEVLIVDDGSTDGTRDRIRELARKYGKHACPLRVIFKEKNEGKGSAIAVGVQQAQGNVIVIQDADLEYNPGDYPVLLKPIVEGRADVVYGSRFLGSETNVLLFWHMVANRILTLLCNLLSNLNLTDVWTGYKAFRADVLRQLELKSKGFGFEPEITIKVAALGCRIYEVPIRYEGRTAAEGKKIGAKDAVTGLLAMLRAYLCPGVDSSARKARRDGRALFDAIESRLGRDVLLIGLEPGHIGQYLLDRDHLTLADADGRYMAETELTYRGWDYIQVRQFELERSEAAQPLQGKFDTVVSRGALERAKDRGAFLKNAAKLLKRGGNFLLWAPLAERDRAAADLAAAGLAVEPGFDGNWLNARTAG